MNKSTLLKELKAKPWNSKTQLIVGGAIIYSLAVFVGPYFGCGAGATDLTQGSFTCKGGDMPWAVKLQIAGVIAFASLCWGRAMSLYKQADKVKQNNN